MYVLRSTTGSRIGGRSRRSYARMCSVAGTAFFEGTVHSAVDAEGKDERECRSEICIAPSECVSISAYCNPHRVVTLASHNKMHQLTSHSKSNHYEIAGLPSYSSPTPMCTASHFATPRDPTHVHSRIVNTTYARAGKRSSAMQWTPLNRAQRDHVVHKEEPQHT
jgi:hypothetical protein